MTNRHPLTDDLCCQIWQDNKDNWLMWQEPCPSTRQIMRAAYDKGMEDRLEQVIEWLKGNLGSSMYLQLVEDNVLGESGTEVNVGYVIQHLREEMRPQVVDLPQANSDVCGEKGMERALQRTFEENDELMRKLSDS